MFNINPINVPIVGVVENMAYFTPKELPDNKYYIFGTGGGRRLAEDFNVPFLGEIPIVQSIREGGDSGNPVVINHEEQIVSDAFVNLAGEVARNVAIRNANFEATKVVEMVR